MTFHDAALHHDLDLVRWQSAVGSEQRSARLLDDSKTAAGYVATLLELIISLPCRRLGLTAQRGARAIAGQFKKEECKCLLA